MFERPGKATLSTSGFVRDSGVMFVICAGATAYGVTMDLQDHCMIQTRFHGSGLSNNEQASAINQLIIERKIDPCRSRTFAFDEVGHTHQPMDESKHLHGNMACFENTKWLGHGAQ